MQPYAQCTHIEHIVNQDGLFQFSWDLMNFEFMLITIKQDLFNASFVCLQRLRSHTIDMGSYINAYPISTFFRHLV